MKKIVLTFLVMVFISANAFAADYTLTITVPDDKITELTEMIDARLPNMYGKNRIEEGMTYVEWMEFIIVEYLKANYLSWKRDQIAAETSVNPADVIQ